MANSEMHVLRESLELLILKALTWGPRHGYAISEWIEHATGTILFVDEGTLYPALHRLARQRLIEAEWGLSENNRKAKYYQLTAVGRARLNVKAPAWHAYVEAIACALRATSPDPVR